MRCDARWPQYSELMASLRAGAGSDEGEHDMEISFEPGLEDKARAALKAKADRERAEQLGVWEQYLDMRRQKRKDRKAGKKDTRKGNGDDDDDDMDPELMNDPFFRDNADFGPEYARPKGKGASEDGKKGKKGKGKETDDERRQRAELELLLVGMWRR
jgi:hypothetical protein